MLPCGTCLHNTDCYGYCIGIFVYKIASRLGGNLSYLNGTSPG